jgi:hypothetical protein
VPEDFFSIEGPTNAVVRLAQLNVSPVENAPNAIFHIRGFAAFGTATIQSEKGTTYRVSLRQAFLGVETLGCQIEPGSIREELLQEGQYSEMAAFEDQSETAGTFGAEIKAGVAPSAITAGIKSAIGGRHLSSKKHKQERKRQARIARVEYVGGGWRFGERGGGDPLKLGAVLDGKYLDGSAPWAAFRNTNAQGQFSVTFLLSMPYGMLLAYPSEPAGSFASKIMPKWENTRTTAEAVETLKAVVAGLVICSSPGNLEKPSSGEIVLSRSQITGRVLPELNAPLVAREVPQVITRKGSSKRARKSKTRPSPHPNNETG